jgi:hypothetical protein
MIEAGESEQILWGDGNWIFWDVGFATERKSSGLLIGDEEPKCLRFADATRQIVEHVTRAESPTGLVIEAPLSVCFNKHGNPTGRSVEKERTMEGQTKTRYWYMGLGCSVTVLAMYLMRAIAEASPKNPVRLFEGFVSFKDHADRTDHGLDAKLLREVAREPVRFANCIVSSDRLQADPEDKIVSAFKVCGFAFGVPAVIKK